MIKIYLSAKMKVFGREATRLSTILLSLLDLLVSAMIEFTLSCVVSGVVDQIQVDPHSATHPSHLSRQERIKR